MGFFFKNPLTESELTNVAGGTLTYQGIELTEEEMGMTLGELAATERFSQLNNYQSLLGFHWDKTLTALTQQYGEEALQQLSDLFNTASA